MQLTKHYFNNANTNVTVTDIIMQEALQNGSKCFYSGQIYLF